MMAEESPLLTREEAIDFLRTSSTTFSRIQHKIPCVRLSKRKTYMREDLINYIRQQKDTPCPDKVKFSIKGRDRHTGSIVSQLTGKSFEEALGLRSR